MMHKKHCKLLVLILSYGISTNAFADEISNPCGENNSVLINILDRPTIGDSACAVPFGKAVLEAGYEYQELTHSAGYQQNFPEAELRIGLPDNNELVILPPNFIHQSMTTSGYASSTIGIKHEMGYNQNWLDAIEVLATLPSGSTSYGSDGLGAAFNGIVSYTFNPTFNLSFMLGGSTETLPTLNNGGRFNSINPDVVFTYSATDKLDLYVEIYGQTKTNPTENSGSNSDAGIIYALLPNFTVDLEVGQRISGNLGGFNHYVGTGIGVLL